MNVAAVVLAAGASSRMGGFPKALLDYEGETFVSRLVRILGAHCGPVVVVLGHSADLIRPAIPAGAVIVRNADPSRGMLSSLQCGLEASRNADFVLFTPVDYPAIQESTVRQLCEAEGQIVFPRDTGKRGHPVRVSRAVADELLALPDGAEARDIIRARTGLHRYVEVNDPGVHLDVDDPDAYAALRSGLAGSANRAGGPC